VVSWAENEDDDFYNETVAEGATLYKKPILAKYTGFIQEVDILFWPIQNNKVHHWYVNFIIQG